MNSWKKKPTLLGKVMFKNNTFMKYHKKMQYKCPHYWKYPFDKYYNWFESFKKPFAFVISHFVFILIIVIEDSFF
jgi:hypothetical protein